VEATPMKDSMKVCGRCKYWVKTDGNGWGGCFRKKPAKKKQVRK
jgi:hypothetical protein